LYIPSWLKNTPNCKVWAKHFTDVTEDTSRFLISSPSSSNSSSSKKVASSSLLWLHFCHYLWKCCIYGSSKHETLKIFSIFELRLLPECLWYSSTWDVNPVIVINLGIHWCHGWIVLVSIFKHTILFLNNHFKNPLISLYFLSTNVIIFLDETGLDWDCRRFAFSMWLTLLLDTFTENLIFLLLSTVIWMFIFLSKTFL